LTTRPTAALVVSDVVGVGGLDQQVAEDAVELLSWPA
jgi:hypothetical protein